MFVRLQFDWTPTQAASPRLSRCAICGSNTAGCERSMLLKGNSCNKGEQLSSMCDTI